MDSQAFRIDLVRPALKVTNLWSMNSEAIILGTALVESNLDAVKQIGGGPALSFMQIEPATYIDVLRYLNRGDNKLLKERILTACYLDTFPEPDALTWNIRLAILIARVKYWMVPEPLPYFGDVEGMGRYWKRYYNTEQGAGTIADFVKAWEAREHEIET